MARALAPVSWQRMSDAVENVRRRLLRAAAALDGASVPYAAVGGNAVAAWVSRADEAAEKTCDNQPEANAAITESEGTGDFRLISLEALVRMKLSAFRDKDRVHLRDLASVGLIGKSWLDRFSGTMRNRLNGILTSPDE
jgi:hypothetical protein